MVWLFTGAFVSKLTVQGIHAHLLELLCSFSKGKAGLFPEEFANQSLNFNLEL